MCSIIYKADDAGVYSPLPIQPAGRRKGEPPPTPMNLYKQSLVFGLLFFIVMLLVAVFHDDGILTVFELEEEIIELKQSNEALTRENSRIRGEIEGLKTDPRAVEKIAREKLNWVKPGETVYQIVKKKE